MKSLNEHLLEYGKLLQETNVQKAYKGLIQYIKLLRKHFKETYPEYDVSGNLYQGYMDLTFFSLTTKATKQRNLKYIVVFEHDKLQFEVWLSGKNRTIMSEYHKKFNEYDLKDYALTADEKGMSSIIKATLVEKPDFDNLADLTNQIDLGVINFIQEVENKYLISEQDRYGAV